MLNTGEVIGLIKSMSGKIDQSTIETVVDTWLEDHPEAITVSDGSITKAKLSSALQDDIDDKVEKVSGAVTGNFAGLDGNGNLIDSGSKASDFGTYSKPSGGIPSTDLATEVQTSLGLADTAYQKPNNGIPVSDLAAGVIPSVPVQDVQIKNTSILNNGVANIPLAATGAVGLVQGNNTYGTAVTAAGDIMIYRADDSAIKNGNGEYKPIVPYTEHQAVFYGLAKAAGDTTQRESQNNVGAYTSSAQSAIQTMLDVPSMRSVSHVAKKPTESVSFIDNTWINNSGVAETDSSYEATDYIDLEDVVAISFTGKTGSSFSVFWYNDEKTFISASLKLSDRMAWFENIMRYRSDDAAFVRIQSKKMTASNPPEITPEVTVFFDTNSIVALGDAIVGDGVTDDTLAVQKIVNMGESVVFPQRDTILISDQIHIQLGYARVIDGNGCNIVVDDDFCAFSVTGTLNTASEPTGMDAFVVKNESCTLIKNFRITANDSTEGCGIELTKGCKTKLCNNYIHHMKNGIRVYGRNRELIISENNVFAMIESCILFDSGSNLHQCNIGNNMLQYAHDVILVDEPSSVANFQIFGNDIEIINYPSSSYSTAKCIYFKSVSTCSQFSEIEIVGNTIQGHKTSTYVIKLEGVDDHEIKNVSITGNHISNSLNSAINMEYVNNVSISGNNYIEINNFVYEMDGECSAVSITGDVGVKINHETVAAGGKLHAASTATLENIRCKNTNFYPHDTVSIQTSSVTNVDVYDEKDIVVSGSTPSITAVPNARYICGEVSTLSFTPCSSGTCAVVFTSGTTPTTLTVPSGLLWSDNFDPTSLDASITYEISVLNGTLGVAAKWA